MGKIFQLKMEPDGIGVVTFDVAGDAMNTWTEATLNDFGAVIGELKAAKGLKGVIFISGKPDNFFAGANLQMVAGIGSADEAMKMLNIFHGSFNNLQRLNIPTVAAIHGHCLGGGLEFSLAFTARIAKEGKNTLIGLPECNVGLFPGGGGTQRLPRLIGYPAIELILRGTMLSASRACELGIVDRLVPPEGDLLPEAKKLLQEIIAGEARLKRPAFDFSGIDQVCDGARKEILKMTRGRELPAHRLALSAMRDGLKVSLGEGLEIEKKYFVQVVMTPEARGSINTFFIKTLTDKPRALMTKGFAPKPLKKIAILGFGTMGRGIAIDVLRHTTLPLVIKDIPEALAPGKAYVQKVLAGMAEKKRLKETVDGILGRLQLTPDYGETFKDVDLVVEAVFEDIKVKAQVYGELCRVVRADCIIASNTSSIPINRMAAFVQGSERFGGMHFFSPVWMMQLVEVIRGLATSDETYGVVEGVAKAMGKTPVEVNDFPGFVSNRVLMPMINEAIYAVYEGVATPQAVDTVMKLGMNHPMGPLTLADFIGLDTCLAILRVLHEGLGDPKYRPCPLLVKMVDAGWLGKKSKRGFYTY